MDATEPFSLWIPTSATTPELEQFLNQQAAIDALLEGKESPSTVLDMLAEGGVDPLQYVGGVELAVDAVIAQNLFIENAALFLRARE